MKQKYNRKLLVEGTDDQHVIWSLCQKFDIEENFEVIDCKGISNLLDQIPVRLKESDINVIGIIIDADVEINSRWVSLSAILKSSGFICPKNIPQEGLVIMNNSVKIGVWIMPDNNINGMLEDFISFLIPNEDKLEVVANETLEYIEKQKINKYNPIHKSKAKIHSWLSWQEDPGTPMGLAITKKYLSTDGAHCSLFINWLITTFK